MSGPGVSGTVVSGTVVSGTGDELLEAACAALARGEVIGLPTDTVYGLAARAADPVACQKIFALKGRPEKVALPVLVATAGQAAQLSAPSHHRALARLAERFWPGALTVVVPRASGVVLELGGAPESVGLRCPDETLVRQLAERVGPLATTSANPHGQAPLHDAASVRSAFATLLVLDGGRRDGAPSTVVSLLGAEPKLLRPGPVSVGEVVAALGGSPVES